jgi:NADP-dependent 3-hydroxy acid dehydrogenase YdfG
MRVAVIEPGAAAIELADHTTNERARAVQDQRGKLTDLLEADDIGRAAVNAISQPRVSVNEIVIRPTSQER